MQQNCVVCVSWCNSHSQGIPIDTACSCSTLSAQLGLRTVRSHFPNTARCSPRKRVMRRRLRLWAGTQVNLSRQQAAENLRSQAVLCKAVWWQHRWPAGVALYEARSGTLHRPTSGQQASTACREHAHLSPHRVAPDGERPLLSVRCVTLNSPTHHTGSAFRELTPVFECRFTRRHSGYVSVAAARYACWRGGRRITEFWGTLRTLCIWPRGGSGGE